MDLAVHVVETADMWTLTRWKYSKRLLKEDFPTRDLAIQEMMRFTTRMYALGQKDARRAPIPRVPTMDRNSYP